MTKVTVDYINGNYAAYDVEDTILDDYYFKNDSIFFDAIDDDGDRLIVIIPFQNVKVIKIYKEEKMNGKEKRKELTEEADRELLRKN